MSEYIKSEKDLQDEVFDKFTPKKKSSLCLGLSYDLLSRLSDEAYTEFRIENGMDIFSPIDFGIHADRVFNCGSLLEFKISEDEHTLFRANFCKDRLCPMCQWRRSMKIFSQVSSCMNYLQSNNSSVRFIFLTLTVKNCSAQDLPGLISKLETGWRNLTRHKRFIKSVLGSFRALEVTYNRLRDDFHPHLHIVLVVSSSYFKGSNYIPQSVWSEMWSNAAGLDYDPVVDVRTIKDDGIGLGKAVAEVSKYAVKGADYLRFDRLTNAKIVYAFSTALYGRKLCSFTGVFREARKALSLDSVEDGDLVHTGDEVLRDDIASSIIRYQWRFGCYSKLSEEH